MTDPKRLKAELLTDGMLDEAGVARLRGELGPRGWRERTDVDFLTELRQEATALPRSFDALFFEALRAHLLALENLGAGEARWLRRLLFADGRIDEEEKKFLRELRGAARHVSREFRDLYDECQR